jgi:hypothetical protein
VATALAIVTPSGPSALFTYVNNNQKFFVSLRARTGVPSSGAVLIGLDHSGRFNIKRALIVLVVRAFLGPGLASKTCVPCSSDAMAQARATSRHGLGLSLELSVPKSLGVWQSRSATESTPASYHSSLYSDRPQVPCFIARQSMAAYGR